MKMLCWILACLTVGAVEARATDAPRPNIVVFLADDLGSADVPWRGGNYTMPVLDALAKQSMRLETYYVHPMCSPTRAALLSGRYANRFGCTAAQNERKGASHQIWVTCRQPPAPLTSCLVRSVTGRAAEFIYSSRCSKASP